MKINSVSHPVSRYLAMAVAFVLSAVASLGCATQPTHVTMAVTTTPSGAEVKSSAGWTCISPCTQQVERESKLQLEVTKANHTTVVEEVEVPRFQSSWMASRIGFGIGSFAGYVSADMADVLGSVLLEGLFGIDDPGDLLSDTEKFVAMLRGGLLIGSLGYGIDRLRDQRRIELPIQVEVSLQELKSAE